MEFSRLARKLSSIKLYKCEIYIVLVCIFLTVMVNLSTFIYRSFDTPSGQVFVGTQFYSDDYAVYVSDIRQGQDGRWTVIDKYTAEPHQPSLIHEEYLLWGKLTSLLGISPILAYHFGRGVFGLLFLCLIYLLLLKLFPQHEQSYLRIASFLLICFAGGFLTKINGIHQLRLGWLTELDPTQRFGAVPHYLLGFIGLLGVLTNFFSIIGGRRDLDTFFHLALFGFLGVFCLPSSFFLLVSIMGTFWLLAGFWHLLKKDKDALKVFKSSLPPIAVCIFLSFPVLVYYFYILRIPPWSHILVKEAENQGAFSFKEYLLALGPVSFLCLTGLLAFKKKPKIIAILFSWITVSLIWSFLLASLFRLNPTRFLQTPVYIPMAILTVLGITNLVKKPVWQSAVIGLILLLGLPASLASLKIQYQMYAGHSGLIYPEDYLVEGYNFLEKNTDKNETVLAFYMAANIIPFMSGNTVYMGHLQETVNYPEKFNLAKSFFYGQMTEVQARDFLEKGRVKYVFWGPQEKSFGGKIDDYPFFESIFDNGKVTIFKVK